MDEQNGRWLLVLDNADDMEIFYSVDKSKVNAHGEEGTALSSYLPSRSEGSILITTRDKTVGRNLANGREPIVVLSMTPDEGKAMLRSRVPNIQSEVDLDKIPVELEFVPLAISQAAAFIGQNCITPSKYLELLQANEAAILDEGFYDWRRDPDAQNSVTRTWSLSFDLIRKQKPYAADIHSLMSVLDRQGLQKTLFYEENVEEAELVAAFGTLQAFSLITVDKAGAVFEMHRLVQTSTQRWLGLHGTIKHWQAKALSLLYEKFPEGTYENWKLCEALISHVQVVLSYEYETQPSRLQYATLLHHAGDFDFMQGRYETAEKKLRQALEEKEKMLGVNHLDTLTTVTLLAEVLIDQGKTQVAEELSRRALEEREKVQGEDHPETLRIVNDLAIVFQNQGKYQHAEEMYWRVLKVNEKALGKDHLDVLKCLNNLSLVLRDQGKYELAEEMNWRALKAREKVLGENHPDTLRGVNHLAALYYDQGKYEAAEELYLRALNGRQKVLVRIIQGHWTLSTF